MILKCGSNFLNISETSLLEIIIDYIFRYFVDFTNMLLNNKYLPEFNYSEKHSLKITGNLEEVMKEIQDLKIHDDLVIPPFLIELMGRKSKALLLFKNRWTTIY